MRPLTGSTWCFAHDPTRADDRDDARSRGGHVAQSRASEYAPYDVEADNAAMDEIVREMTAESDGLLAELVRERQEQDRLDAEVLAENDRLLRESELP